MLLHPCLIKLRFSLLVKYSVELNRIVIVIVSAQQVSVIILVPSRELSQQASTAVQQLTTFCRKDVTSLDVSVEQDVELLRWETVQSIRILVNDFVML